MRALELQHHRALEALGKGDSPGDPLRFDRLDLVDSAARFDGLFYNFVDGLRRR